MRGMRAIWSVLKTARRPEDLRDGRRYTFEGGRRLFRTRKIEEYIAERERVWRDGFEGLLPHATCHSHEWVSRELNQT